MGFYKASVENIEWGLFLKPFKQELDYRVTLVFIAASVTFCYANIFLQWKYLKFLGHCIRLMPRRSVYSILHIGSASENFLPVHFLIDG